MLDQIKINKVNNTNMAPHALFLDSLLSHNVHVLRQAVRRAHSEPWVSELVSESYY